MSAYAFADSSVFSSPRPSRSPAAASATEPFQSVEEAWIWTMTALVARREGMGMRKYGVGTPRPCDADDVVKCLDSLYRRRRIDLGHARVLRRWGERGRAPNPASNAEHTDWMMWTEALERLDWPLRVKGIVA